MRRLLYVISCILVNMAASAQITLVQSDYPASLVGSDSLKVTVYTSAIPSLPAGAGLFWDLGSITDSLPVFFAYRVASSTYPFADSGQFQILAFRYFGDVQSAVLATGVEEYGVNVFDTGIDISSLTTTFGDSIFIPAQYSTYSSTRTRLALPATFNTAWSSQYQCDVDFQLSVAFYSYNHAPGIVRKYVTETDSITGWGKMRVKDIGGAPSDYWSVLQVETRMVTRDSFYLNGALMSNVLLSTFGIAQGMTDTTYEQAFYRTGELTPLALVAFRDAAYLQPYKVTTHVQRLVNVGLINIEKETAINVYPNPSSVQVVNLDLPATYGHWDYILTDENGRNLQYGVLEQVNGKGCLKLCAAISTGLYYLRLQNDNGELRTIQLEVVR